MKILHSFFYRLYEKIMGEKVGENIKSFVKDLLQIGLSSIISAGLIAIFNILSGRILGPAEYGKFTVTQSVATFLHVPMLLGFNTAMIKYVSEKSDHRVKKEIISTSYYIVAFLIFITTIFCLIFKTQVIKLFSISIEIYYFSIIFSILFTLYIFTTDTLRGLFKMKLFSVSQIIYAVILLLTFLFFILVKNTHSFHSMLYATLLSYIVPSVFLLIFFLIRRYIRFIFNKFWSLQLTKYSIFATIGGLSSAIYTNIDKILINKYMTPTDLGIYKAYYFASINMIGFFWRIFNIVFFPTASKHQNKLAIFRKINNIVPYLIVFGIPFIFILEVIIIKFYGKKYPFDFRLAIIFSIATIVVFINSFYVWLMAAVGQKGIKVTAISEFVSAVINVCMNLLLLPRIGILGAPVAMVISYLFFLILVISKKHLFYEVKGE